MFMPISFLFSQTKKTRYKSIIVNTLHRVRLSFRHPGLNHA
nr:MAG TPA: hypothetical protein [Caudoviricetes sp.]